MFLLTCIFLNVIGHPKLVPIIPDNVDGNSSPESVHELADSVNGPTFKHIGIFSTLLCGRKPQDLESSTLLHTVTTLP